MRSHLKKNYHFHAHANSLGGFIDKPVPKHMPPQASSSLPGVGGHITTRTEAHNFEEIISCRCAYTRVSGRVAEEHGGSGSVLVTSVVEGLNILEVVTADRIVAQVSIHTVAGQPHQISFAGSRFEGLLIGAHDPGVEFNRRLLGYGPKPEDPRIVVTSPLFNETGREQAAKLVGSIKGKDQEPFQWLTDQYRWMASGPDKGQERPVLCSLVDGLKNEIPARSFGHVVEIPDFGRLYLGEFLFYGGVIDLSMIRAELGCNTSGGVSAASASIGVHSIPP
jgi:hypothetical protein